MYKTAKQRANRKYYLKRKKQLQKLEKLQKLKSLEDFNESDESDEFNESDQFNEVDDIENNKKSNNKNLTPSLCFNDDGNNNKTICLYKNKKGKEFVISVKDKKDNIVKSFNKDGEYFHIKNCSSKRDCLYICAPNQSGKTTYCSRYLSQFVKDNPEKDIYLFSKIQEDELLDKFDPIRLNIEKFKFRENTLQLFSDSIVIFDDVDQIHDKEVSKKIYNLINSILCEGAHFNINILITNHLLSNYQKTRTILNEVSSITMFPKSGCSHQMEYVLKNYIGLGKKEIAKIKNLNTRWVTIFKNYPQLVLHQNGVYLLN